MSKMSSNSAYILIFETCKWVIWFSFDESKAFNGTFGQRILPYDDVPELSRAGRAFSAEKPKSNFTRTRNLFGYWNIFEIWKFSLAGSGENYSNYNL